MKIKLITSLLASLLVCGALVGCDDDNSGVIDCQNHQWNDGVVTTQPTTTSEGVKIYTCLVCGQTKTESISALEQEKFRVTYDANGGTGAPIVDANEYVAGDRVTVKENTFTAPEGKEFIAWNEAADESGAYYRAGSTFKIYEDVTLYAQWDDIQTVDGNHVIKVNAAGGVSYTLSKTKALEGEEITLTLTLEDGVTLDGNPTSSETTLTKQSENVYKFTMPNKAVNINIKIALNGDFLLTGDISANLTDDDHDGIYEADVTCTSKTSYDFSFVVKDSHGNPKKLDYLKDFDPTKCDAIVTFISDKNNPNKLNIIGGCTYTFCYDSNLPNYNCYVVRKSVDNLPTTAANYTNLFDGASYNTSTIHPQGLTSISYRKTVNASATHPLASHSGSYVPQDVEYTYKKISDTESFSVSTNSLNAKGPEYVYENIDTTNNVYSIINTFPVGDGNNEENDNVFKVDPYSTFNDDAEHFLPYSAKFDIVSNNLYRETSRYQITEREAYRNVKMAAHYGSALESETYDATRPQSFDPNGTNIPNEAGCYYNITSSTRGGGFQVVIDSQLEYDSTPSGNTADIEMHLAHKFNVTMTFKTNGDLVTMDYTENYYTQNNWDFTKHEPKADGVPVTVRINVTYGYNETFDRTTVLGSFNPADYFISSIDKLSFYNSVAGAKENNVSVMNYDDSLDIYAYKEGKNPTALVDEFEFTPATALDKWQYGVVATSDRAVVDDTPWGYKTVGVGTCDVTFGNRLENMAGATKTISVKVDAKGTFHELCFHGYMDGYDSTGDVEDGYTANKTQAFAGQTLKFCMYSGSNTGCPISYYIVVHGINKFGKDAYYGTSPYFNVVNSVGTVNDPDVTGECYKMVGQDLIMDFNTEASNALTKKITVELILMSDFYAPYPGESGGYYGPSSIFIDINPAIEPLVGSKYTACRVYDDDSNAKYEDGFVEFYSGGTGKITEILYNKNGSVRATNIYNFTYSEKKNREITAVITSVVIGDGETPDDVRDYELHMKRNTEGKLCVYLTTSYGDIFGEWVDEGEEYYRFDYEIFEKVVD